MNVLRRVLITATNERLGRKFTTLETVLRLQLSSGRDSLLARRVPFSHLVEKFCKFLPRIIY